MAIEYLDGVRLYRGVAAGLQKVISRKEYLNKINVFPVPDGDTGTNMAHTLATIEKIIRDNVHLHIQKMSQMIADCALDGARGNSGAIFAQFFVGLSEGILDTEKIIASQFAFAANSAKVASYDAMMKPKEGTMLSVIKAWSNTINEIVKQTNDFKVILQEGLNNARVALAYTPKQLEVLAKAGVVDAGAQGFVDFLEGVQSYIETGEIPHYETILPTIDDEPKNIELQDEFQFCTECEIIGKELNRIEVKEAIQNLGGSIVLAGGKTKLKLHIHTNDPKNVFDVCRKFGEVIDEKADDMLRQQKDSRTKHGTIAVVVDSACDLPEDVITENNIHVIPVRLNFGEEHFIDKVTITNKEFWEKFNTATEHPKTSQPTPGDFRRQYQFLDEHYESVVSIHLPLKVSGTVQSANVASKDFKDSKIHIFESNNGSVGLGLIALKVAEEINSGKKIEEVLEIIKESIEKTKIYVYLPTLEFVVKGGRLPEKKAKILNLLKLTPILTFTNDGLKPAGFIFGKNNSRNKFLKFIKKKISKEDKVGIAHANIGDDIIGIGNEMQKLVSKEIVISDLGPALGVHGGPGAMVIAIQKQ